MSQKIIYTCDVCGMKGHEAKEPSKECIEALKQEIGLSASKNIPTYRPIYPVWPQPHYPPYRNPWDPIVWC